jgi:hypothetical protein
MSLLECNNCGYNGYKAREQRMYCDRCRLAKAKIQNANYAIKKEYHFRDGDPDRLAKYRSKIRAAEAKLSMLETRGGKA